MPPVSLRGEPVEHDATLPDGTAVHVRIGVPDDSYIAKRELDTVAIELSAHGEHIAAVDTLLDADQTGQAQALMREIVSGLESGALEPTAHALEPLADNARRT
jgi:hypothetical protein